eukprot:g25343.t1
MICLDFQKAFDKGPHRKLLNKIRAHGVREIENKSRDVLLGLYKVLVRLHLEYCEQFWALYLRKDVLVLEMVQKRFTRMIPGMEGLSHEEQLWTL